MGFDISGCSPNDGSHGAAAQHDAAAGGGSGPPSAQSLEQLLAGLVTAVDALVHALGGAAALGGATSAPASAAAASPGVATPVAAPPTAATIPETRTTRTSARERTAAPGASPDPVRRGGGADGPGVDRHIIPRAKLEQDPKLRGKLDPPTGGRPPKGVRVRTKADGTRVLTINIHGGSPGGKSPSRGQDIRALRDVARYVNAVDPDVVMVQELNDLKGSNIPHTPSVFAQLMQASDMAFTPGAGTRGQHRDSAIFTRNGYTIERAMNVDLPDAGDPARRSAGVAVIQPPDGRPAFTAIATHLSHMPSQAASDRRHDQLVEIDRIARSIEATGGFAYRDPMGGRHEVTGFPSDRLVFGGDLNTTQGGRHANDSADRELRDSGLRHANDLDPRGLPRNGHLDHLYARGFDVSGSAYAQVGRHELDAGSPTDHPGFVADLR
jgi:endonuclease/exonuclease/phosphatase family metal-dependent hydrolase